MATLQNSLAHMRNAAVLVNGTRYQIDQNGIARNVKSEDAQKLLQNKKAWRAYSKGAELSGKRKAKKVETVAEVAVVNPVPPVPPADFVAPADPVAPVSLTQPPKSEDATLPDKYAEETAIAQDQCAAETSPAIDSTGEWPDPDMKMSKPYLQKMADAYEILYSDKTLKDELIANIMAAMYPEA